MYLDASKKAQLVEQFHPTLPGRSIPDLIDEIAAAIVSPQNFLAGHFSGVAAAGPVALVGAEVGDKVLMLTDLTNAGDGSDSFESTITVADQIQQTDAADLSAVNFSALILKQN
jgi:hypothetical protein